MRRTPITPDQGLGRVGRLAEPLTLRDLGLRAQTVYGSGGVTLGGDPDAQVERVACCTGSGAGMIGAAQAAAADALVTCDLKYHDADRAEGLALVGLQHAVVERRAMERWSQLLAGDLAESGVGGPVCRHRHRPVGPVGLSGAVRAGILPGPTADVAQLARASACHAEGRGFESLHPLLDGPGTRAFPGRRGEAG